MPTLNWLGNDKAKQTARHVPYRLLETVSQHGDAESDNLLIQGDNLEALKALLPFYAGQVKCIFIDPPYNTKSAFEHYDDNLEHSQWLSMIYPRLELLRDLLSEDGSIWITIDDNEAHYLKVIMDELFGRSKFFANVIWRSTDNSNNNAKTFSLDTNHLLVYAKSNTWAPRFLEDKGKRSHFKNPDNDPRGPWFDGNPVNNPALRPNLQFDLIAPNGIVIKHPPNGWRWSEETIEEKLNSGELRFSPDGRRLIRRTYLNDMNNGLPPSNLWIDLDETGHNRQAKYELKNLFPEMPVTSLFGTPKPEKLIQKILEHSTDIGDFVLDSFLGSGTTSAVAHKMKRRWIGVEMGEHAKTHCLPRLEKVLEGEQGGISKTVNWEGGGGFRFMQLGEPAFMDDGRINPAVRFATLAAYLWFLDSKTPHASGEFASPIIGTVGEGETLTAYALLYNGILGDRRPNGGNVLTSHVWDYLKSLLPDHSGRWVIYGEASRMPEARRKAQNIEFRQIPYEIRLR